MIIKAINLFIVFCISISIMGQELKNKEIVFKPIGVFHTSYTADTGAPRQGALEPDKKASIEIFPEYHAALHTLELFEYIIILYHFDKVQSWSPIVKPPASTDEHEFGLFATRSPRRPNPIGFSVVKLEKIENGILYISGADAFNGTPVLDIKPYLPSIDSFVSEQNHEVEQELGHHDEKFINDSTFYK